MERLKKNCKLSDIKNWLTENKVLFVTNSPVMPGSMFMSSLGTYSDYIPVHNFYIIPGIKNDKPFYGVNAYLELIALCLTERVFKKFDYVIYIDEDCFITDFRAMLDAFFNFAHGDEYCLAGPQDGGVICHRNHQHWMINTFISFWNMKLLRNATDPRGFTDSINRIAKQPRANQFAYFDSLLPVELKNQIESSARERIADMKNFRETHFGESGVCPFSEVIKNDPDNPVEKHQNPYTTSYGVELFNFEPYYIVEQNIILLTGKPIYYLRATDYYKPGESEDEMDNTGITSACYGVDSDEPYCVHTWYSRFYSKWPSDTQMLKHTNRINKVIMKYGYL